MVNILFTHTGRMCPRKGQICGFKTFIILWFSLYVLQWKGNLFRLVWVVVQQRRYISKCEADLMFIDLCGHSSYHSPIIDVLSNDNY